MGLNIKLNRNIYSTSEHHIQTQKSDRSIVRVSLAKSSLEVEEAADFCCIDKLQSFSDLITVTFPDKIFRPREPAAVDTVECWVTIFIFKRSQGFHQLTRILLFRRSFVRFIKNILLDNLF